MVGGVKRWRNRHNRTVKDNITARNVEGQVSIFQGRIYWSSLADVIQY